MKSSGSIRQASDVSKRAVSTIVNQRLSPTHARADATDVV